MKFIFLFLLFSLPVFAEPCQLLEERLSPVLEKQFWNTNKDTGYVPYRCERNTSRLTSHVSAFQKAEVVAVWKLSQNPIAERRGKKENWQILKPLRSRQKDAEWAYHVFLVVDGFVLDLDFEVSPKLISLNEYLKEMYSETIGSENERLWFTSWPAESYSTSQVGRYGPSSPTASLQSLQEFLASKSEIFNCADYK